MKRKSLLLLVPFAVAAMAGCTPVEKKDGGQCDSATVTLNKESLTLEKGETYQLEATISVENCPINWSTSAAGVATVSEDGLVTAVGKGTATISANGTAFCEVIVNEEAPVPDNPVHLGTEADPYDSADAACVASKLPQGDVTTDSFYIKDTVKKLEETFNPQYGNYSFNIGHDFICWRLKKGPNSEAFNDGDIAPGDEVVVYAQIQKFHQGATEDKPERTLLETKGGYVVSVKKNTPVKEIESIDGIVQEGLPKQVPVGGTISPSSINLNVTYTTGETGTVHPDKVEFDNSKIAENVVVSCTYGNFSPVTFTVNVTDQGQAVYGTEDNPISVSQALTTMRLDCPADTNLTKQAMYCIGTVKEIKNVYHYEGDIGSDCFELVLTDGTNDVIVYRLHSTDDLKDQVAEGNEIKICGYGKNFKGTLEFVDNGATKCTLLDNGTPTPEKEVTQVLSVKSHPESVVVGGTIAPSSVILNVKLSDGSESTAAATKVECNTQAAADSVEATAWYKEVGSAKFNIKVVAQGQAVYGTEDNPISVTQAIETMTIDCPEDTNLTKQAMYCIGTVKEIKNVYHYEGDIGSDCYELVLTDGTNDVIVYRLHSTDDLKDQVAEGNEIKICGYGKNFKGTLEFVDNGATKCTLLDNGTPTPQKVVTGITAASYTKTLYVGGTINPADVTLTVTYSDDTSGSVKAQSVDGYSTEEAGNTTATAHYGTFTKDFVVEVKAKPAPSGNSYNLIKSNDDVTEGQYLIVYGSKSFNGVDTTANYATVDVSDESIEASDELVYVEFEEMSGGYAIKVVGGDNDEKYIYGQSGQNKLLFDTNKKLNTISVDNDGKATIVSETSILKFNTNTGTSDDRFRYYKSTNTDEKMALPSLYKLGTPTPQKTITGVELQGTLAKSSYVAGQTFDPSGLSLKVTYNEGDPDVLTSGFTFNVTNPLEVGEYDLKATYQGHTTEGSVHISVVAKELVSIAITHGMNKTTYQVGDEWDATGIVVEGTYNDGDIQIIPSTSYELSYNPTKATDIEVTSVSILAKMVAGDEISSEAYPQTVTVQEDPVTEPVLVDITIEGSLTKSDYKVGETYSAAGLSVLGHYDNESTKTLDVAITFNKTVAALGDTAIIASVEYEDLSDEKEFTVTVTKVDENVIDVSSVNSYSITPDGEGLPSSYNDGSNTNFAWTGLYKGQSDSIQGNSSKSSELHNIRAFSKEITYIKFNVGYAAGDASTGEVRFGSSAQPTGNAGKYGANTDYSLTKVGSFVLFAPSASTYLSVVWTKGASYFSSIDVHFDEYNEEGSAVESVSLNKDSITLEAGSSETLVPTIAPSDAANKQVTWESSDEDIATVDSTGKVTAVAEGTATITVTTKDGGKTDTCSVTVTKASEGGSTAIDLGGDVSVVFGGVTYEKSLKAGTGKVAGSTAINVPSGAKKLIFYAAGWNGETVKISVTGGGISQTLSLTSDSGVSGNSPFTIGSTTESNFKFEIDVSSLIGATTLTLAATSGNRFVVWNASYTK